MYLIVGWCLVVSFIGPVVFFTAGCFCREAMRSDLFQVSCPILR